MLQAYHLRLQAYHLRWPTMDMLAEAQVVTRPLTDTSVLL
jgi:hypothetical protein